MTSCSMLLFVSFVFLYLAEVKGFSHTSDVTLVWSGNNKADQTYVLHCWDVDGGASINSSGKRPNIIIPARFYTTNLKSLVADYKRREIIFADWLTNIIGVVPLDLPTQYQYYQLVDDGNVESVVMASEYRFEGLRHQLHNLAFTDDVALDEITGNIYYPTLNSIWLVNMEIKSYLEIISDLPARIKALAVHPTQRFLFFSLYGKLAYSSTNSMATSMLMRSDLAGEGRKVLLAFPDINEVKGIAVDYIENKIYFIDTTLASSRVLSSDLDGNKLQTIYEANMTSFRKIDFYNGTVFVIGEAGTQQNKTLSYLWMISAAGRSEPVVVELSEEPLAITVLVNNEDIYKSKDLSNGSCSFSPPCDQFCLPRAYAERLCMCRFGEVANGTECRDLSIDNPPPNVPPGSDSGSSGPILFLVLIPVCGLIIAALWIIYHRRKLKKAQESANDLDPTTNPSEKLNPDGVAEGDEIPHSSHSMTSHTRPHSYYAVSRSEPQSSVMMTSNNRPHTVMMTPLDGDDED